MPTVTDFMSSVGGNAATAVLAAATSAAFQANQALLLEFRPHRDVSVSSLIWFTGATVSGNYDIGIYTAAGVRLWSKGSTAWPTASTRVVETVTPTALTAGTRYFLALAGDNATGLFRGLVESFVDQIKSVTGEYLSRSVSSSFPLPSTLTVGTTRGGKYPVITVHGT